MPPLADAQFPPPAATNCVIHFFLVAPAPYGPALSPPLPQVNLSPRQGSWWTPAPDTVAARASKWRPLVAATGVLAQGRPSGRGGGTSRPRGAPMTASTCPVRVTNASPRGWSGGWSGDKHGWRIPPHHLPSATTPRTTICGVSIAMMRTSLTIPPAAPARARRRTALTRLQMPAGTRVSRCECDEIVAQHAAEGPPTPLKALQLATRRGNWPHGTTPGPRSSA